MSSPGRRYSSGGPRTLRTLLLVGFAVAAMGACAPAGGGASGDDRTAGTGCETTF